MQLPPASQIWPRQTVPNTPSPRDMGAQSGAQSGTQTGEQTSKQSGAQVSTGSNPHTHSPTKTEATNASGSPQSSLSEAVRGIFAAYDLTSITPTEVDRLTTRLKEARFDDLGFVLSLERYGASYASEMQAIYTTSSLETAEDVPIDLLALTRSELAMAERYGQPTERLSTQLFKLEEAHNSRADVPRRTETTASVSDPSLAETLVLFQAQRLWVE